MSKDLKKYSTDELANLIKISRPGSKKSRQALDELILRRKEIRKKLHNQQQSSPANINKEHTIPSSELPTTTRSPVRVPRSRSVELRSPSK